MVSPIAYVMSGINRVIPPQILKAAFTPEIHGKSLDACIMEQVIIPYVLKDAIVSAGKQKTIYLEAPWRVPLDVPKGDYRYPGLSTGASVYTIPPHAREHRDIVDIIRVRFASAVASAHAASGTGFIVERGNSISNLLDASLRSRTYSDVPLEPTAQFLNNNMVRVCPGIHTDGLVLECLLSYDEEFTNLSKSSYQALQSMAISAVKIYIYTQLRIPIDANQVINGVSVGVFKEIVEGYSQELAVYEERKVEFAGSTIMDPQRSAVLAGLAL